MSYLEYVVTATPVWI